MVLILIPTLLVLLLGFMIAGFMGAPWVPAYRRDVEAVLNDVKLAKGEVFIELGSGDGRLVAAAAERGAKAIGYEINPVMWFIGWVRCYRLPNASIRWGNLWNVDLSGADVVMVFLMPKFMGRLEEKLASEMPKGSRMVAYVFKLPNRKAMISRHHWFVYEF